MAQSFYQAGPARAQRVNDLFSVVAPRYDLINDLQSFGLHRFWKWRLIRLARIEPGHRILDVCCGTGDVALRCAKAGGRVVGIDFSEFMLRQAQVRARASHARVHFVRGDALRLPFPDEQFDVVTVSYGLRNLADFERGLREMLRVARPGGRLLVLDFGKPRHPLLRAGYFAYLGHCVPIFGSVLCGDRAPYAYILESLRHYPAQEGVAAILSKIGCERLALFNLLGGIMSINYAEKPAAGQPVTASRSSVLCSAPATSS